MEGREGEKAGGREERKERRKKKEGQKEEKRKIGSHQVSAISRHLQVVTVVWQLVELGIPNSHCLPRKGHAVLALASLDLTLQEHVGHFQARSVPGLPSASACRVRRLESSLSSPDNG